MRRATLASILRKSRPGVRLNSTWSTTAGLTVFQHACQLGCEGIVSKRLGWRYRLGTIAGLAQVQKAGRAGGAP